MKPVLILKTGSTYPILRQHYGDFEDWIGRGWASALRCAWWTPWMAIPCRTPRRPPAL